ncbi:GNAT family N-acetyltransferase [Paucibacter sp. PLA-PC-4]|uniref:GNAT family N-acetyltransferase n=1 Tax=Paucibacter sp. PLA-PC-4 TaxID=2993655 RepID=UPI00224B049E|nr:GNAT family N-acetyltransferase [Paucibacter sp. PLA-PC-4]
MSNAMPAFVLHTERLLLRAPTVALTAAVVDYQARNMAHFARWDPPYPADFFASAAVTERLAQGEQSFAAGSAYRYWFSLRDDPARLIGQVHLSQVARGAFQNAILGYSLDEQAQGLGLMREALRAVIAEMFGAQVRLHRIQAAVRPENQRSRAVLQALGFAQEGLSRRYLFIDGQWRDHEVYALLNPQWEHDLAP